jgi:peptide-methionine (S)-S-oxide reductase
MHLFKKIGLFWIVLLTLSEVSGQTHSTAPITTETAVFAGGCFWGVDAVFKHVKGVTAVVSGYAGGKKANPSYEQVSTGSSGHAESVSVTYDPKIVSYDTLLKVFFKVAHDPTQLNRQGPDSGTQYRSAIFYKSSEQKKNAQLAVDSFNKSKAFSNPIVTEVTALIEFYPAEPYHQNYLSTHTTQPYIVFNDLPKLEALKKEFPELYY